jgi:rubrerythrin
MTEENLNSAYGGESKAHMRYLIFAERAERDKLPNVARLFRAIAFAEQAHATNHLRNLGQIQSTADNLQEAIAGETFEVQEMYPAYQAVAELQGEKRALTGIEYALAAEKIHAAMYQEAKDAVDGGHDVELGTVQICSVCGHTLVGDAPDRCPVCNAKKDAYVAF